MAFGLKMKEEKIKKLDKKNVLGSIRDFPKQAKQAWKEAKMVKIDSGCKGVENLVVCGMGGSGLGGDLIKSLFQIKVPFVLVNDYELPYFVNEKSLVLVASYSGGTKETISCLKEAIKRRAKILGITTGGELAEILKRNSLQGYIFEARFNYCNQPRIGLGYMIFGQLALFEKCGFLKVGNRVIEETIRFLEKENDEIEKRAREYVEKIGEKAIIYVSSQFLSGNSHILANQTNENSKLFSSYFLIPELNHHLMEGLTFPKSNRDNLLFLFIESRLYSEEIKKRIRVTKKVVRRNKVEHLSYQARGEDKFKQAMEVVLFGTYLSFYLGIKRGIDPSKIPWVDYFKKKLG